MMVRRFVATVGILGVSAAGLGTGAVAPAGAATCYSGTWRMTEASANRVVKTPYGRLTVAPVPGGVVRLTLGTGTWSLDVDKSFSATGSGPLGNASGTVAVDTIANGTFKAKPNGSLAVRISAASGTATFDGTVNGTPTHYPYNIVKNDVNAYFGIKGKAIPTCSAGPRLSLRFKTATLSFVR